ncbi:G0/G1 switch protein 2 [Bagarius yarrelli]|uniref:G0/G1 switch protein 2 n=1 Tax=Bagarius yarrelli TaxID=175774 RepID=A0A556V2I8_BAGYA|nr:G0/G1 switch protein 2 [Bagarius yarrelli]
MEMMQEIIPFAKEMISARPSKGAMKIYLVGGTFAVLGIMSGMVEAACSLFPEQEEITLTKQMEEIITATAPTPEPQTVIPEDDELDAEMEAKAKELPMLRQRRMSFRAHAS